MLCVCGAQVKFGSSGCCDGGFGYSWVWGQWGGVLGVVWVPWVGCGCCGGLWVPWEVSAGLCWVLPSWGAVEGQGDPGDTPTPPS